MKVLSVVLLLVGVYYSSGADPKCVVDDAAFPASIKATTLDRAALVKNSWYEVRKINSAYATGGCISVTYSENTTAPDVLNVVYKSWVDKKEQVTTYKLKFITPSAEGVTPTVNKYKDTFNIVKSDDTPVEEGYTYRFLLMENEKYVVVYGCKPAAAAGTKDTPKISILSAEANLGRKEGLIEYYLQKLEAITTDLDGEGWASVGQDSKVCSSASIFGLSTMLSTIVAMLLVLRN